MTKRDPFKYFKTSPEIIRLAVMMYVRYPLSLRNVEDLLHERGIDICHETVRFWWNRFGPLKSERNGFNNFVLIRTGNGIWTRYL
jgi:putative transposase